MWVEHQCQCKQSSEFAVSRDHFTRSKLVSLLERGGVEIILLNTLHKIQKPDLHIGVFEIFIISHLIQ